MRHRLITFLVVVMSFAACSVAAAQTPAGNDCTGSDPDRAIAACTLILQQGGRLPPQVQVETLQHRGAAYVKTRDYDRAIADYDAALRLDPNNPHTYNSRGFASQKKGDHDRAIADYDAAIRLDPRNPLYFHNRGIAYRWKGDYDRAIADNSQAIQLNPTYALAYGERALVYRLKLDFTRALADHDTAIRYAPQAARAYMNRGRTYEAMEDYQRALADYRQGVTLGGQSDRAIRRVEQRIAAQAMATPTPAAGSPAAGRTEVRIALVIGNSKYANAPVLVNPQNDAQALATALQRIGFTQVTLKLDLTHEKVLTELKAFAAAADRADWAVVYFAGHGLEVNGLNYLVPVDAKLASDRDVTFEAVSHEQILQAVDGARKLRLVILDACRDNPFLKTMTRSASSTRSIERGLANVEPEGGTLVVYAAKDGHISSDGPGSNSPFMTALIKNLNTSGLEINLLFRKVRDDVFAATDKRQEPWTYGSLPSELFYFRKP